MAVALRPVDGSGVPLAVDARRRRLLLAALGGGLWPTAPRAEAPAVPGSSWLRRDAAQSGWSAEILAQADAAARRIGTDMLLVAHRGAIVHELGATDAPVQLYSVRKSLLSMLIGMQVDAGRIDLRSTLAELGIDDKGGLSEQEKTATVQQLLQARSGVYHPAAYETASMAASRPPRGAHAPGTQWVYNNWDFNTLATIFHQRSGRPVFDALDADLARPLQFEHWQRERDGRYHREAASEHPAYPLQLSARDLARAGLLMARGGLWAGTRHLSERWVHESTQPHSRVGPGGSGYGYMWWVPERAWPFWSRAPGEVFFAEGNHGQMLVVDRARDLVVVHLTDHRRWLRRSVEVPQIGQVLERVIAAAPAA